MEIKYRGISYCRESQPSQAIESQKTTSEEVTLTWRGQTYVKKNPVDFVVVSSQYQLQYRGISYHRLYACPVNNYSEMSLIKKHNIK